MEPLSVFAVVELSACDTLEGSSLVVDSGLSRLVSEAPLKCLLGIRPPLELCLGFLS